ncbi:MAG: DUF6783 domain-containing protein [Ruminococcus sp.]
MRIFHPNSVVVAATTPSSGKSPQIVAHLAESLFQTRSEFAALPKAP